jgi:hypothetical protein
MKTISPTIIKFLETTYNLTQEQVDFFNKYKYIKLKEVLNDETLQFLNEVITEQVNLMNTEKTALEDRSTYDKAFLQLFNLWKEDVFVKELVFSKRIAKIASDLYDPLTMPPVLIKAHNELDKAVDLAYRPQPFTSEANRMVFLFELYEKYTADLFTKEKPKKTKKTA